MDGQPTDYPQWLWEKLGQHCVENLGKHGFKARLVDGIDAARDWILELAGHFESFGFGGSDTVRRLGLIERLKQMGKTIYDHWQPGLSLEEIHRVRLAQGRADCFLCSANAVSLTGEIVNVDGAGNRTAAMSFGPRQVVIVAGMNKVAPDLNAALQRVKEKAAPMRARSLNMATPCAETGLCTDCNAPQRICRITTILHRCPMTTPVAVVLVRRSLGF
ncbi:MAG: lactate utilization protein [Deltaproteobacteria bacterium]|nr:lactate utilization protein [Deltaproteobacteria bacterium]